MDHPLPVPESASLSAAPAESVSLQLAKVVTLLAGVVIVLSGLLVGFVYLLFSLSATTRLGASAVNSVTISFSIVALSLALGGSLVFQAVGSLTKRPSSVFRTPSPAIFLLAFLAVVLWGALIALGASQVRLLFPIPYVLGIALPIVWLLAVVGNRLVRRGVLVTWRETILQLASGAFAVISVAVVLEVVAVVAMILTALIVIAIMPGGAATLRAWAVALQDPAWLDDPNQVRNVILSPGVAIGLYLLVALVIPLIEELLKAIGVVFMSYRHPSQAQALWWGLLGGAGFALTEGLLNTNLAAGDMSWITIAPLRFGTSVLHCCTGALMGLGWYALIARGRWQEWGTRYLQAVGLHFAWNTVALTLAFVSLSLSPQDPNTLPLTPVSASLTACLIIEAIAMLLILLRLVARGAVQRDRSVLTLPHSLV